MLKNWDREKLREEFNSATPFRFFKVDNLVDEKALAEIIDAYPGYAEATNLGRQFDAVNEKFKVQITDSAKFPPPVRALADLFSSQAFLDDLEYITGIPKLLADEAFDGGGMHISNKAGRLDVHVDFNVNETMQTFRRLNILLYLNPTWQEDWGGRIELWDPEVKNCVQSFAPIANRCVVFETNEISFHGVTPIRCPDGFARKSFAAYYYTKEAPAGWDGKSHSTVFRARPDEAFRGKVLMPAEQAKRAIGSLMARSRKAVGKIVKGD